MLDAVSQVITQVLLYLYEFSGNLGLAVLIFTLLVRSILFPITLSSLKAAHKIKELQPELSKLKKQHGKDAKALQTAQMEMYKKYNVNPLSGCLPQLVQLGVLLLLYHVLSTFLQQSQIDGITIDPTFLWLNLTQPDHLYILPILAAVTQLILSVMIAPGAETRDIVPNKSTNKDVKDANKKEEDMAEMAASMQQQMLYIMPVMTGVIALRFPAGLPLYWIATTLFSIGQQWYVSGPGGLKTYYLRIKSAVTGSTNNA
jgi:YidC/Oxa1 family membrane protein insertase